MVGRRPSTRARASSIRAISPRWTTRWRRTSKTYGLQRQGVHDGRARVARSGRIASARARRRGALGETRARRGARSSATTASNSRDASDASSRSLRFHRRLFVIAYARVARRARLARRAVASLATSRRSASRSLVNLRLREQHVPSSLRARDVAAFRGVVVSRRFARARARVARRSRRARRSSVRLTLGSYFTNSSLRGTRFGFLRLT